MLNQPIRQSHTLPHTDQTRNPLPLLDPDIHTKVLQKEDKRCGPETALKDDLFGLETDPLCTTTDQVFPERRKSYALVALQKKRSVDWLERGSYFSDAKSLASCGSHFAYFRCSGGHEKSTKMHCRKEYCPVCGELDSREHKRKVIRAKDRLMWASTLGYTVFTLPREVSQSRPDVDTLKYLSKKAWEITERHFPTVGGTVHTHFMGNLPARFHIHFNVIFPITGSDGVGVVDPGVLDRVRADWTAVINSFFDLDIPRANIHYRFAATATQKGHLVKYVFRPVVNADMFDSLSEDGRHYYMSLKGWHNTRWFGKLANCSYKDFLSGMGVELAKEENADPHLSNVCPICSSKFKFQGVIHKDDLPTTQMRWLDCDTLVDFGLYSAIKEREKLLESSHV